MRTSILAFLFLALASINSAPLGATLPLFSTAKEAQHHCPQDTVVWLNLPTGVYHFQGQRWYGNTKTGAYVCQKEADAAGDRAAKNGQ